MTPAEHLHLAESFARLGEDLYYRSASHAEPDKEMCLRRAEVLAQMAQARAALAWASIVDDPHVPHPGDDWRPATVHDLTAHKTAPASPGKPAGADDPNTREDAES